MTEPAPVFASWAEIEEKSFWVHLKEPWSDELEAADFDTIEKLQRLAHIWGTVAGAAHRRAGADGLYIGDFLGARLTDQEVQQIEARAIAYVAILHEEYEDLARDARTIKARRSVEEAIR